MSTADSLAFNETNVRVKFKFLGDMPDCSIRSSEVVNLTKDNSEINVVIETNVVVYGFSGFSCTC